MIEIEGLGRFDVKPMPSRTLVGTYLEHEGLRLFVTQQRLLYSHAVREGEYFGYAARSRRLVELLVQAAELTSVEASRWNTHYEERDRQHALGIAQALFLRTADQLGIELTPDQLALTVHDDAEEA